MDAIKRRHLIQTLGHKHGTKNSLTMLTNMLTSKHEKIIFYQTEKGNSPVEEFLE